MTSVIDEIERQRSNNVTSLSHFDSFASHRVRLTALVAAAAVRESASSAQVAEQGRRLCVLGAGNCNDLDLEQLSDCYEELHLVDLDEQALARAVLRQKESVRRRITSHTRVDLSGMLEKLERWRRLQVTAEELAEHAATCSGKLAATLKAPFDTVLSACVLSQMQLSLLNVLSDKHQLFQAVSYTLNVTHLQTLAHLLAPSGRALLATDIASDQIAPLTNLTPTSDLQSLLDELLSRGEVFNVLDPRLLKAVVQDNPTLRGEVTCEGPRNVWLWHNGPKRLLLVYALELRRQAAPLRSPREL